MSMRMLSCRPPQAAVVLKLRPVIAKAATRASSWWRRAVPAGEAGARPARTRGDSRRRSNRLNCIVMVDPDAAVDFVAHVEFLSCPVETGVRREPEMAVPAAARANESLDR